MPVLQTRPEFLTEPHGGRTTVKPLAMKLIAAGRTFGPYLAIELILPGGSLLALLLWLYLTFPARAASTNT
jgi:hypothetical protein